MWSLLVKVETGTAIPKGFIVEIESWENDGDHYGTVMNTGLTKEQADFLVKIARAFVSKNGSYTNRSASGFGNDEISFSVITFLVKTICELQEESSKSVLERFGLTKYFEFDKGDWISFLNEYVTGDSVEYDWGFCRVVETIKVSYLSEDFVVPDIKLQQISTETV